MASWYGGRFHGRKTASGERFDQGDLTAAHRTLPFGTLVCVRSAVTGKTVAEKIALLERTSYRDYLTRVLGCSDEVANCFQGRTLDFFAVGCDAVAASDARDLAPFERMLVAVRQPFAEDGDQAYFAEPAPAEVTAYYQTFCGT